MAKIVLPPPNPRPKALGEEPPAVHSACQHNQVLAAMASTPIEMASNLVAMASNLKLVAMASSPIEMASNLAMAS